MLVVESGGGMRDCDGGGGGVPPLPFIPIGVTVRPGGGFTPN